MKLFELLIFTPGNYLFALSKVYQKLSESEVGRLNLRISGIQLGIHLFKGHLTTESKATSKQNGAIPPYSCVDSEFFAARMKTIKMQMLLFRLLNTNAQFFEASLNFGQEFLFIKRMTSD